MTFNVVNLERYKTTGKSLPRVRLNQDLHPERLNEFLLEGVVYRKGWQGSVVEIEPFGNHVDCLPIVFDDYFEPVWIPRKYLEQTQ